MYRNALKSLIDWVQQVHRKPILLRGARQVGKSFLVKMLADEIFDTLVTVNFEQTPDLVDLFKSKQPKNIIALLEIQFEQSIIPGKTLLFLDEIQAAPEVITCLRYFYEELPELHIIAAGSLLEFVLEDHEFSMPVGRIEYMHLGPMHFEEFLLACNKKELVQFLQEYSIGNTIPKPIHNNLMQYIKNYCFIGGMPEAVAQFTATGSYLQSEKILSSILSTYADDFSKYGRQVNHQRLLKVFMRLPQLVGQKLKYTQIDREEKSRDLKAALDLLARAKIVYLIQHSDANGIPLGAQANAKFIKPLFLDVGLLCHACGLRMTNVQPSTNIMLINSGAVCEQFVGQHLLYAGQYYENPQLYCWIRQQGSSNAEVDYVMSNGTRIIPIEVKAGKTGSLKSLHLFLSKKQINFGLRFNADQPSIVNAYTSVAGTTATAFKLLSLPFYLIGQTKRLISSVNA